MFSLPKKPPTPGFVFALVTASQYVRPGAQFLRRNSWEVPCFWTIWLWVKKKTQTGTTGFGLFFLLPIGFFRSPFSTHSHIAQKMFLGVFAVLGNIFPCQTGVFWVPFLIHPQLTGLLLDPQRPLWFTFGGQTD